MRYNYRITLYFRNGKILELLGNQASTFTDPGGISMILMLDKTVIVELPEGIGNVFEEGEVVHYNAFPRPALYDLFPSDWDPINGRFNLIDKIIINSRGCEASSSVKAVPPGSPGSPGSPGGC